ncbi:MAG TPA: alpha/beta fold hydrolase [Thermoanaerobaculia bacterium]|nr:alpha/beta fold hydrolase [Thermoanaerobaculia bacterium]
MNTRLIRFAAADGVLLPGLLYQPRKQTREAAIFLHGNGDSSIFYSAERTNAFAEEMVRRGIAFFPFNNRGAGLIKTLKRRTRTIRRTVTAGMTYEKIRDCVADIEGAIACLRHEGYRRIHLIGHSTGANKICHYNRRRRRNPVGKCILLAPGDDVGIYYDQLGPRRFHPALERGRVMVKKGEGHRLAPASLSPFPISWTSLLDTIDPDGDYNVFPFLDAMRGLGLSKRPLFRDYRLLKKPTLSLFGANDEFCFGDVPRCVDLLRAHAAVPRRFEGVVLPDANHGFGGHEREAGAIMAEFLRG